MVSRTRLCGSLTGRRRSNTWSSNVKIAVFAPMPSAKVSTATTVNPGLRRKVRSAYCKSRTPVRHAPIMSIGTLPSLRGFDLPHRRRQGAVVPLQEQDDHKTKDRHDTETNEPGCSSCEGCCRERSRRKLPMESHFRSQGGLRIEPGRSSRGVGLASVGGLRQLHACGASYDGNV